MVNREEKLTASLIRDAKHPASGDYTLRDTECRGLGLRVSPGAKTWIIRKKLRGQSFRHTVGHYPEMTLDQARKQAQIDLGVFAAGKHPTLAREATADETKKQWLINGFTVANMWEFYITQARIKKPFSDASIRDFRFITSRMSEDPLWTRSFAKLTDEDILESFKRISTSNDRRATNGGQTSANLIFRNLSTAANHAITKKFKDNRVNPFSSALKTEWHSARPRTRTIILEKDSFSKWWAAIGALRAKRDDGDRRSRSCAVIADFLALVLLWGGRKTETAKLQWTDIDFERKIVVFRKTKNGTDHYFPLAPLAESILLRRQCQQKENEAMSAWVFASTRKGTKSGEYTYIKEPKAAIRWVVERSGVAFSTHDLRRTFSNLVATGQVGAEILFIKMAMNHSTKADVTANNYLDKVEKLRPVYIGLENLILQKSGNLITQQVALSSDELEQFREWQISRKNMT